MLIELPQTKAAPENGAITQEEAAALARATVRLFERWRLSDSQARDLLGGMAARTWARWKSGDIGRVDRDLATRMSLLMGIHKGLRMLFSEPERGYDWIQRPNADFAGETALDVMLDGSIFALERVRRYLDAERSPW